MLCNYCGIALGEGRGDFLESRFNFIANYECGVQDCEEHQLVTLSKVNKTSKNFVLSFHPQFAPK